MKTTIKGICINLNESEYYFKYKGIVFYFSSEFYRNKFANQVQDFIERETFKLEVKYDINIQYDLMFMIALYKKIEKRGFRIVDDENKKEITPSCGLVASLIMY